MASTFDLDTLTTVAARAGAKVVLVGDPAQIGVINGPGGLLTALAHRGHGIELSGVHRFDNAWERDASLRLRAGDPTVIDTYTRAGRLHPVDEPDDAVVAVFSALANGPQCGRRCADARPHPSRRRPPQHPRQSSRPSQRRIPRARTRQQHQPLAGRRHRPHQTQQPAAARRRQPRQKRRPLPRPVPHHRRRPARRRPRRPRPHPPTRRLRRRTPRLRLGHHHRHRPRIHLRRRRRARSPRPRPRTPLRRHDPRTPENHAYIAGNRDDDCDHQHTNPQPAADRILIDALARSGRQHAAHTLLEHAKTATPASRRDEPTAVPAPSAGRWRPTRPRTRNAPDPGTTGPVRTL